MATVVNNPSDSGSGMSFVLGIILLLVLAFFFFVYGLPLLTGGAGTGTQGTLPSEVNVNTR